ncbi:hypothetical protein UFOVP96_35 [uncultured Caudovirales phage]|uniref:Replicative helicase inhibitor G39P N-terminal domain-containing protein n=1 Tax=uncultured Caudovirales phage TaxID=2100421 RepID=A0A6J5L3G8_9CAUD|nr:hypothetical protein UFOVP96_35 [uncultured Caudovirales phage]
MTENEKIGFKSMMNSITTIYSRPELDRETLRIWWAKLEKYPFLTVSKSFDNYVNSNKFMPTISDIVDLCRASEPKPFVKALPRHFSEEELQNNHAKMKALAKEMANKGATDPKAWARKIINDYEKGKYKMELGVKFAREALRVK